MRKFPSNDCSLQQQFNLAYKLRLVIIISHFIFLLKSKSMNTLKHGSLFIFQKQNKLFVIKIITKYNKLLDNLLVGNSGRLGGKLLNIFPTQMSYIFVQLFIESPRIFFLSQHSSFILCVFDNIIIGIISYAAIFIQLFYIYSYVILYNKTQQKAFLDLNENMVLKLEFSLSNHQHSQCPMPSLP